MCMFVCVICACDYGKVQSVYLYLYHFVHCFLDVSWCSFFWATWEVLDFLVLFLSLFLSRVGPECNKVAALGARSAIPHECKVGYLHRSPWVDSWVFQVCGGFQSFYDIFQIHSLQGKRKRCQALPWIDGFRGSASRSSSARPVGHWGYCKFIQLNAVFLVILQSPSNFLAYGDSEMHLTSFDLALSSCNPYT